LARVRGSVSVAPGTDLSHGVGEVRKPRLERQAAYDPEHAADKGNQDCYPPKIDAVAGRLTLRIGNSTSL
jgi:hypothetical protein